MLNNCLSSAIVFVEGVDDGVEGMKGVVGFFAGHEQVKVLFEPFLLKLSSMLALLIKSVGESLG